MPRITLHKPDQASADIVKPLPSLVDEIAAILGDLSTQLSPNIQLTPSIQSWTDVYGLSPLDWSAVPAAVDAGSTSMGLSTAKSEKKRAKKLQKLDKDKVNARVFRKRQQVESFLAVFQPLLSAAATIPNKQQQQQQQQPSLHIVDFGCGSGNLLLPLAALFPSCTFTGVDMKPAALHLLQQRAAAAGLANVAVFEGMIEHYVQPFDIGLALHACGNATDHVLQMAVDRGAAFIVSPCCVGKLKFSLTGGSSFHSKPINWTPTQPGDRPAAASSTQTTTQQQQQQLERTQSNQAQEQQLEQEQQQQKVPEVTGDAAAGVCVLKLQHPRSVWLRGQLPNPERHFRIMARVADIAHAPADQALLGAALAQRAAVADSCKRFVELDRCAAAAEAGYAVGLFKVLGAETMAKNDLLVGIPTAQPAAAAAAGTAGEAAAAAVAPACGLASCSSGFVARGLLFTAASQGWITSRASI